MGLKSMKHLLNIRFIFDKIDPAKARIIIDKANIVLVPPRGGTCWTPDIRMNKLKRHSRHTRGR
jgi:hypothetical protein